MSPWMCELGAVETGLAGVDTVVMGETAKPAPVPTLGLATIHGCLKRRMAPTIRHSLGPLCGGPNCAVNNRSTNDQDRLSQHRISRPLRIQLGVSNTNSSSSSRARLN